MNTLHVDCGTCIARGPACSDCVISVLLGVPEVGATTHQVDLTGDEQSALAALAGSGMLPPLRLVSAVDAPQPLAETPLAAGEVGPKDSQPQLRCQDYA